MDIRDKARRFERTIERTVHAALGELVGHGDAAPLEIVHGVLACAEEQITPAGGGRRLFPFNRIIVRVFAPARDHVMRAQVTAVFDGPPSIKERLLERLRAAQCTAAIDSIDLVFSSKRGEGWTHRDFDVAFERVAAAPVELSASASGAAAAPAAPPRLRVAVLNGTTGRNAYAFATARIDIGRRVEVLNAKQELVRTNHIAFADDEAEANRSVSRKHAHIIWSGSEYRLADDRSAHGTRIVRDGRTIPVPAGTRGVRLRAGDEILLGSARLRVMFAAGS